MIKAFVGDNVPAREQAAKNAVATFVSQNSLVAVDKFNGEDLDLSNLIDAISTVPFLSAKRMVVVKNLSSLKLSPEQLDNIAKNVADTTELIIVEDHIDNRGKYLGWLKNIAEVNEFPHLEGDSLVNWTIEQTKSLNGHISRSSAQALIDRVGNNHQLLYSELQKLVIYDKEISLNNIELLTVFNPQSSVFAMLDSAFAGNTKKSLKLYEEQRYQGMEPQAILGMIVWQLNILAIVKAAGSRSVQDIASQASLSPFVVRKNQSVAARISDQHLAYLLKKAIDTDLAIKTTKVDSDKVLQTLIMAFS